MKAITFLGITSYEETTYRFDNAEYRTQFFAEALPQLFPAIDKVLVVVTPTVENHSNYATLKTRLGERFMPLRIPEGHSEKDLWEIFDTLTNAIGVGEQVVFDITNSFRSLPFLIFLIAAYLRTTRKVEVHEIVYGAFQAKQQDITPVFRLSPFIQLLDWLTATDQFVETGDARRLARLLNGQNLTKGPVMEAAMALEEVSYAAFLCQPFTLMEAAGQLDKRLEKAEPQLVQLARPFQTIRQTITSTFNNFAATSQTQPLNELTTQFHLIEWYLENNQWMQAVTLAREWLISAVTYRLGEPIDLTNEMRDTMEKAVSGLEMYHNQRKITTCDGEKRIFTEDDLNKYGRIIYDTWSEYEEIAKLWAALRTVRNAFAHAQHQKDRMRISKIVQIVKNQIMPGLRKLAQSWNLIETSLASP